MHNKQLLFNSLKVLFRDKIQTNTLLKPIDCIILSSKMCSNEPVRLPNHSRILVPPEQVKGMTEFDRDAFTKEIKFPALYCEARNIKFVQKLLYAHLVRLLHFKPISDFDEKVIEKEGDCKLVVLNPELVSTFDCFDEHIREDLEQLKITSNNFIFVNKEVTFDNWKPDDLIEAVLPEGLRFSGYSIVGHIAHFNLRPDLFKYKKILGMIVLQKIKKVKTVVNKLDIIDNTYRNFKMEVICGSDELVTSLKENGCSYELDFSTVYWNSRLSTEHERIVDKLSRGDVLYDVFAGIGPFAVPAAKKGCTVLANDLNPESVRWLKRNVKKNNIDKNVHIFNKDAKDFILVDLKEHLLGVIDNFENNQLSAHIVMNLPAGAVTYLDYFKGLFTLKESEKLPRDIVVYVYCFVKDETRDLARSKERAKELVISHLGPQAEGNIKEVFDVRHVSTNKDMFRVTINLAREILVKHSLKRTLEQDDVVDFVTGKHKQVFE